MFSSSKLSVLVISSLLASVVLGWSANTPSHQGASSRRAFLDTAAKVVPLVALSAPAFADEEEAAPAAPPAEEPAPAPAAGGDEENEFIARLKKQSEANKAKYDQQAIRSDKLSNGQFSAQYDRPSYKGIRRADGSFEMVLSKDFDALVKSGKVEFLVDDKVYAYK